MSLAACAKARVNLIIGPRLTLLFAVAHPRFCAFEFALFALAVGMISRRSRFDTCPRKSARDGFNPNPFVIFCLHSLSNPLFFIHFCIRFVIDRIPDELDTLDSNRSFFIFPAMACRRVKSGVLVYFVKIKLEFNNVALCEFCIT